MNFKNWILQEEMSIKKQSHNYDCGPAALFSILSHFGIKNVNYKKLVKQCKTTKDYGTLTENLVKAAKLYNLKVKQHEKMTIKELQDITNKKIPVIASIQSWGNEKSKNNIESGHYVIVTKVDKEYVHFYDPYYQSKDKRKMKKDEFMKDWIDENNGKIIHQFGISFQY